jgi:ATP-dependent exoDNAse (exonuclease V) beta subunit
MSQLKDHTARLMALTQLDRSFFYEAGAGSGKTSLLAGRTVGLLVKGVKPANIVSVSFTEMAAAELMDRIFNFATGLYEGRMPADIASAYPNGLTPAERENLRLAIDHLGDLTCTTIHGFCQKLLRPYPVEAAIDPGASILDQTEANLIFDDVLDRWLRSRLSGVDPHEDMITALVGHDASVAVPIIETVARKLRENVDITAAQSVWSDDIHRTFADAVESLSVFTRSVTDVPAEHVGMADDWDDALRKVSAICLLKPHSAVVGLATLALGDAVTIKSGGFRKYRLKGVWRAVHKKDGDRYHQDAETLHDRCCETYAALKAKAAAIGLCELVDAVKPALTAYGNYKRDAALLDFVDLLTRTRSLLRSNAGVLAALQQLYTHILVDEYQDTDPVQTEIFELLSGEILDNGDIVHREGALFLVGDPKQSIYRFRGADVGTYVRKREEMRERDAASVQSIFVNFRSTPGILDFVNTVFNEPLALPRQPGFIPLSAFRLPASDLPVKKYPATSDGAIDDRRRDEAEYIADACASLIGTMDIPGKDGTVRKCTAGDIALLAPVNTRLFWLENALEERGISVATQAGKGLFQQQEVKDMIALTRVLADPRDTLALGALLRGSFFGFTDLELLDVAAALPHTAEGKLTFLNLSTLPEAIANEDLAALIGSLVELRDASSHTTPFDTLHKAVDLFAIRSKTRNRDESNADRRLANVDRYLEMSRAFDVRGLRAFSDAMRDKWENADRISEGKPDGKDNAVSLITIHSSKGLEWPVVFTVNCSANFNNRRAMFEDVKNARVSMPFLRNPPEGHAEFVAECNAEEHAERVRLMYVGLTRARDLLIIPDLPASGDVKAWSDLVAIDLDAIDYIEIDPDSVADHAKYARKAVFEEAVLSQEEYGQAVVAIESARSRIVKRVPSKHEWRAGHMETVHVDDLIDAEPDLNPFANIEGGFARGNILHKLMEEILNGETERDDVSVEARARELIVQFVSAANEKPGQLFAEEIARCVSRTLELPEIVAILPRLVPEVGTSSAIFEDGVETLTMGVSDAVEVSDGGTRKTVVDWKSDLRPSSSAVSNYVEQVRDYLRMDGIERGLVVFMTIGKVVEVRL